MAVQVQSHAIELALQNSVERVEIAIYNGNGNLIDPATLQLNILDTGDRLITSDILYPGPGQVVDPLPSRIRRTARGKYYFPFGVDNANGYPATYYGPVPPIPPFDISVNNQLKLKLDGRPYITVTLTAAIPTAATPNEIVKSINSALIASPSYGEVYGTVARYAFNRLFLTSPTVVDVPSSSIQVDQTVLNNAALVIFGTASTFISVNGDMAFGDTYITALLANRTLLTGDSLFQWQVTAAKGLGSVSIIQVVKVASPKAFAILPYFRTELDKALKQVGQDLARTGYTDAQLMGYLALAVTEINAYQPITNLTLDTFPTRDFMMILIWTALLVALISQGLFAIDTDIDYADRGASFRMDHAAKIQSYVGIIISRLEQRMQQFKLQYADVGTVKFEAGASFRISQILQASPTGSLFRGIFSR